MTPYHQDEWLTVWQGDCRDVMRQMEPESVHCVVTSPPYWGLRDYGVAGALGLEATPEEFVANMVDVFREVKRVLRKDGTCWVNLGDSYVGAPVGSFNGGGFKDKSAETGGRDLTGHATSGTLDKTKATGLKPKDLVGIPWRVAFALQADGWYLRSDIIWAKPNPMPESVTDRPTKSHEYLFLLTKSARYYYDADAVREPARYSGPNGPQHSPYGQGFTRRSESASVEFVKSAMDLGVSIGPDDMAALIERDSPPTWQERKAAGATAGNVGVSDTYQNGVHGAGLSHELGDGGLNRNLRTVWTIATAPYPGAHFATFPPKLVEPCIKAGAPEKVCGECGAGWRRVTERGELVRDDGSAVKLVEPIKRDDSLSAWSRPGGKVETVVPNAHRETVQFGFIPSCKHDAETVPATVLDPFAGSGTVGMVAQSLSRRAVLIDLNGDYLVQAMSRNQQSPLGLETA